MSIHKLEDGTCVIGAAGMWLPGRYENERAARFAFKLTDQQKAELRDISLVENNGIITWNRIKDFRSKKKWWDHDLNRMLSNPPVGTICEVQGKSNAARIPFCKVKVIHHGVTKTVLEALTELRSTKKGDCMVFNTVELEFRPLDHHGVRDGINS